MEWVVKRGNAIWISMLVHIFFMVMWSVVSYLTYGEELRSYKHVTY